MPEPRQTLLCPEYGLLAFLLGCWQKPSRFFRKRRGLPTRRPNFQVRFPGLRSQFTVAFDVRRGAGNRTPRSQVTSRAYRGRPRKKFTTACRVSPQRPLPGGLRSPPKKLHTDTSTGKPAHDPSVTTTSKLDFNGELKAVVLRREAPQKVPRLLFLPVKHRSPHGSLPLGRRTGRSAGSRTLCRFWPEVRRSCE